MLQGFGLCMACRPGAHSQLPPERSASLLYEPLLQRYSCFHSRSPSTSASAMQRHPLSSCPLERLLVHPRIEAHTAQQGAGDDNPGAELYASPSPSLQNLRENQHPSTSRDAVSLHHLLDSLCMHGLKWLHQQENGLFLCCRHLQKCRL